MAANSVTESEYEPCACSPTGKLKRTTMPFTPGAAKKWKTFTYEALGRTVTVQEADGVSNTTYLYEGATVKVTDPAGKWKKFFMNGLGQLWKVEEPRPGGGTYTTTYTYDLLGNLTGVNMPRDGVTQTRTFNYTGPYLTSVTQPESGTTNYVYSGGLMTEKVDADNRKTTWEYDSYKRVTATKAWLWQQYEDPFSLQLVWGWVEQPCQRKEFFYDSNPFDGSYSQNVNGRLAAVRYKPCTSVQTFIEMYSYTPGGLTTKKRFRVEREVFGAANLDGEWTYDNEGKATSVAVPLGPQYSYGYDSMGRPLTLTHSNTVPPAAVISNASYGPAGQLLGITGFNLNETRTYNDRLQLTNITGGGRNITYNYGAGGTNNGQIVSQVEDGETVAYQYDSLKRLISATASGSMTWTQSYGYDGFGNLLSKTGSGNGGGGGPVSASYLINPATNRPFSGYTAAGLPTNSSFDNDNRMISTLSTSGYTEYFAYSPGGKRVWNLGTRQIDQFTQGSVQEVWFWSPQGQRLAFYSLTHAGAPVFTFREANLYLGGKLVGQYRNLYDWVWAHVLHTSDRLGSFGKYYPYGEERNPTGASGEKFATYFHDNVVNLNYADQRWHANSGRFLTPDPSNNNVRPIDSQSWNMYLYTNGDPLNQIDPNGLGLMSWLRGVFGGGGAGQGSGNGGATGAGDGTVQTEIVDQSDGLTESVISTIKFDGEDDDVELSPEARSILGQVFNNLGGLTFQSCGSGAFVYGGGEVRVGPVHGEVLGLANLDQNRGFSTSVLIAGGGGLAAVGGEFGWNWSEGRVELSEIILAGNNPNQQRPPGLGESASGQGSSAANLLVQGSGVTTPVGGVLVQPFSRTIGGFAGFPGVGVGGYINICP